MQSIFIDIIMIYLIFELISIIYALYIGDELNYRINFEVKSRGYKKNTNGRLITIDDLKQLIPFYSILRSRKFLKSSRYLNDYVDSMILSGKYVPVCDDISIYDDHKDVTNEMNIDDSLFIPMPKVAYESPEPYRARSVDNALYDSSISAEEYIIKHTEENKHVNSTPFIRHDTVEDKIKQTAEYITSLPDSELAKLSDLIYQLKKTNDK